MGTRKAWSQGRHRVTTVPYTQALDLYWRFKVYGGLTWTKNWLKKPEASSKAMATTFAESVEAFSIYENEREPFHGTVDGFAPPLSADCWVTGRPIANGNAYAAALIAGATIPSFPPNVEYVDREPDCLRTSATHFFKGLPVTTREAVLPDLLLAHPDGFPILAEVKVKNDANAVYALVQVLAAAAHLVTPSQRIRLGAQYNRLKVPDGPCLDLFVLLHDPPQSGTAPRLAEAARQLAGELLEDAAVAKHIRCIRFLPTNEPAQLIS
jgi:hypothetical protein